MQGQKEINLNKPNKVNATHKITRFVKLNRKKGAVSFINKERYLFNAFHLHKYSTACEYLLCYCSEKLQAGNVAY